MNWSILLAIAILCDVGRDFLDNYITDVYYKKNKSVAQKLFLGICGTIVMTVVLIFSGLDFANLDYVQIGTLILSGIVSSIATVFYYRAIEIEDTTSVSIFFQFQPILYLIAGWLVLNEQISITQLFSFFIILSAPLLIVLTAKKRSRKVKLLAVALIFVYCLLDVGSNMILFATKYESISLFQKIAFFILGRSLGNIGIVVCSPKLLRRFKHVVKTSKGKVFRPLLIDYVLDLICETTYRIALATAPAVAIASVAGDACEPIIIFFVGIFLSVVWPNFGREKLNKRSILSHLAATLLVTAGIILLK